MAIFFLTDPDIANCFPKCSRAFFCGFFRIKYFCLKVASILQLPKQVRVVDLLCTHVTSRPLPGSHWLLRDHVLPWLETSYPEDNEGSLITLKGLNFFPKRNNRRASFIREIRVVTDNSSAVLAYIFTEKNYEFC